VALVERRLGSAPGVLALVPPGVDGVVFTTRVGGVSAAPYASLNLGYSTGDAREAVAVNRRMVAHALGIPVRWAMTRQVHGRSVVEASEEDRQGRPTRDADALVTCDPSVPIVMLAADCVPVALVGARASGVVHAGWRGLAAGAIASGVEAVRSTAPAGDGAVRAWIGPCIGPCHYEVGPEVSDRVASAVPHAPAFTRTTDGRLRFDLRAAARWLLEDAGATVADAEDPPCTWCDERFFSHRRDGGATGRQAVVVWRAAADA
jgi:polyphenol oxidase